VAGASGGRPHARPPPPTTSSAPGRSPVATPRRPQTLGRVTIVIPAYDGEAHLPRAVASARAQRLADTEIVVVDDGSRDRTADVARALGATVLSQPNAGPAAARNRGVRSSASDYVAFLDVDDEWPEHALETLVAILERDPSLDVALGHVQCFVPGDEGAHYAYGPPFVTYLLGAAVYRRQVFERVGLLDESLREGEDVDWFLRARELGAAVRVAPDVTLHYRRRIGSVTFGRGEQTRTLARMLKRSLDRRRGTAAAAADLPAPSAAAASDLPAPSAAAASDLPAPPAAAASDLPAPPAAAHATRTAAVTAVVVVRNGERYLAQALDSIAAGTVVPAEILVVDGHSTDTTASIAARYESVRLLRQAGLGIAAAYNEGIRGARHDVVAFLSHDDRWSPHKLDRQLTHLQAHPECDCAVARVQHFLEPGETPPRGFRRDLLARQPPAFIMETLVARRRAFERAGTFDTSYTVAEDVDWFARAKDAGVRIDVVDDVLLYKRVHGGNTSLNARENNELLLRAVRASIDRKRTRRQS
jgi:glycosyltransferase involved in cell wall biosynthesis